MLCASIGAAYLEARKTSLRKPNTFVYASLQRARSCLCASAPPLYEQLMDTFPMCIFKIVLYNSITISSLAGLPGPTFLVCYQLFHMRGHASSSTARQSRIGELVVPSVVVVVVRFVSR